MSTDLTVKQNKAAKILIAGGDYVEAASAADVTTRTIHRWLDAPAFHDAVAKGKTAAIDAASVRLAGGMDKAIGVMLRIMEDDQAAPSIRLRAANYLLGHALRYIEMQDVIARIEAIEARLQHEV